jgi:hypothetical protein
MKVIALAEAGKMLLTGHVCAKSGLSQHHSNVRRMLQRRIFAAAIRAFM